MQVTLKSLQIEQEHHAALEVDRYAEVLLSELGVTERGLHSLASNLAGVKTTRQRPGFVGAEKLARNWKIGVEAAKRTVDATTQEGCQRLQQCHWKQEIEATCQDVGLQEDSGDCLHRHFSWSP